MDLSFESQLYLSDETGEPLDLENMLKAEENTHIRKPIRIGKRKQLQAYLIAERLSQTETDKRRRSIRYRAKRKAQTPSKTLLRLAGWNLYITNIEPHRLTPKQIGGLAPLRWQIELMFKGFKSIGKLQHSRSQKPYRILAEIYAKLIALLIQQAVMLGAGYRHIQHSFIKTARYIAGYEGSSLEFSSLKNGTCKTLKAIKQAFDGGAFQKSTGKNEPFKDSKTLLKIPKLTPMVRLKAAPVSLKVNLQYFLLLLKSSPCCGEFFVGFDCEWDAGPRTAHTHQMICIA